MVGEGTIRKIEIQNRPWKILGNYWFYYLESFNFRKYI